MRIRDKIDFEDIYNLHWRKVYAVCLFHVKDDELAQDFVQDIFKSLWERRHNLELDGEYENYLVRAAKLKVFEYFRNEEIRRKHKENIKLSTTFISNTTEDHIYVSELTKKISAVTGSLPPQCNRVFNLSRYKGLSNREIAGMLSITEKAVEYHITKALGILRKNLKEFAHLLSLL